MGLLQVFFVADNKIFDLPTPHPSANEVFFDKGGSTFHISVNTAILDTIGKYAVHSAPSSFHLS